MSFSVLLCTGSDATVLLRTIAFQFCEKPLSQDKEGTRRTAELCHLVEFNNKFLYVFWIVFTD